MESTPTRSPAQPALNAAVRHLFNICDGADMTFIAYGWHPPQLQAHVVARDGSHLELTIEARPAPVQE